MTRRRLVGLSWPPSSAARHTEAERLIRAAGDAVPVWCVTEDGAWLMGCPGTRLRALQRRLSALLGRPTRRRYPALSGPLSTGRRVGA